MNLNKTFSYSPFLIIILGLFFRDFSGWSQVFLSGKIWIVLDIVGFLLILYAIIIAKKKPLGAIGGFYKFYLFWTMFVLLRGSLIGNFPLGEPQSFFGSIHDLVSSPYSALGYFIPLVVFTPFRLSDLKIMKTVALIIAPVSLFLLFIHRDSILYSHLYATYAGFTDIETASGYLNLRGLVQKCFPLFGLMIFILLNSSYIKSKCVYLVPLAVIFYFICQSAGGGRSTSVLSFVYIVLWLYVLYKYPISVTGAAKRKFNKILIICFACIFCFGLYYLIAKTEVFNLLFDRILGNSSKDSMFVENNRTFITRQMISDFNNHPLDWLVGRGVNGDYILNDPEYATNGRRRWIEWGYMYFILKGGVIFLFTHIFLFVHASYVGIKKSRNTLSKALGVICLVQILNLCTTSGEPSLMSDYVIPWLCFGLVERKSVRNLTDNDIYYHFNSVKKNGSCV